MFTACFFTTEVKELAHRGRRRFVFLITTLFIVSNLLTPQLGAPLYYSVFLCAPLCTPWLFFSIKTAPLFELLHKFIYELGKFSVNSVN